MALIVHGNLEQRRLAGDDVRREALLLTRLASGDQERLIEDGRHLLIGLAQLPAVRSRNPDVCSSLFANLLKQYTRYSNFGAIDSDGNIYCSAVPLEQPVNVRDGPGFQQTVQTRNFTVGAYQIGLVTGKAMLPLNYPIFDRAGQVRGVVYASLDLDWLNRFAGQAALLPGSTLTVIDRNGTILVRLPSPEKWTGKSVPEAPLVQTILRQQTEGTAEAIGLDNVTRLYAFTPLRGATGGTDAYLIVGIPTQVAFSQADRILARNLTWLGIVAMLGFAAAWFGGKVFILRSVRALVGATGRFASGDLSARTGLSYENGELGQLAHAFDEMAGALEQREVERRQAEEALRRYTERLKILREIDRALLTTQSPEAIARAALSYIRELMGCVRVSITTVDLEAQEATVLAVHVSGETGLGPGARVPLELFGDMEELRQGKARLVEDLQTLSQDSPAVRALRADGVRAIASIPLVTQDALIGSLNLGWESVRALGSEEMEVAREVANSLAVAMQQASLFRSISEHREQLRALAARLAEAEEEERHRIARELHDRVGQSLTALGVNLNILRGELSAESAAKGTARLDDSLRLVEETVSDIRAVMSDLRPPVLDDYGLLAALRWYGEQFSHRTGVTTVVQGGEIMKRLPPAVEMTLFRITQEALTNIAKHARANRATVTLEERNGGIQLTITDYGVGFDPAAPRRRPEQPGWGLMIMRERAEAVGGRLRIESARGRGTRVVVDVGN